jgi:DNA-directed RNA polymerase, omega subunit
MSDKEFIHDDELDNANEDINPPEIDSKYRMIILAAQRSKQLQRGAISRTDIDVRKSKPTRVAMRELEERRVNFTFTDQEEEVLEEAKATE